MRPDQTFVPVRLATLRGDQKIPFDLYVQVGGKFILYVRQGDRVEGSRLGRLRDHNTSKMFILPDVKSEYLNYVKENTERAYSGGPSESIENRSSIVQGLQQAAVEGVLEDPQDPATYNDAKEHSRLFTAFMLNEEKAMKAMVNLSGSEKSVAAHGVSVAIMSLAIAKKIGMGEARNLPMLALGALLHDLAHFVSGTSFAMPLTEMTSQQLTLYKRHPLDGAMMIKDLKHIDQHVVQIILEHEEFVDGTGFPKGLTEPLCNPYSVIVSTANSFDRYVSFDKLGPADAVKRMFMEKIGRHPLDQLNAVKSIVAALQ